MKFWIALSLVIFLLSIGITVLLIKPEKKLPLPVSQQQVKEKFYQNRLFGFQFSYPATTVISEKNGNIVLSDKSDADVVIQIRNDITSTSPSDITLKHFCTDVNKPRSCTSLSSQRILINRQEVSATEYYFSASENVASLSATQVSIVGPYYVINLPDLTGEVTILYLYQVGGKDRTLLDTILESMSYAGKSLKTPDDMKRANLPASGSVQYPQ